MANQFSDSAIKAMQAKAADPAPAAAPSAGSAAAAAAAPAPVDVKGPSPGVILLKKLQKTFAELADASKKHALAFKSWQETHKLHKSFISQLEHSIQGLGQNPTVEQVEAVVKQYRLSKDMVVALRSAVQVAQFSAVADAGDVKAAPIDPSHPSVGRQKLLAFARQSKAYVKAVMWDSESKGWISGINAHGQDLDETSVPETVKTNIKNQPKDNSAYSYGTNCAEVHCVIRAYGDRKRTAGDLKGCVFIAHMGNDGFVGPCHSCRGWILACGGKFIMPKK